jgi:tetratricopeptide (TPR) repeat protein
MFANINLGLTARALGRLAEARMYHERSYLLGKRLGDSMGEAIAVLQLGMDDLLLGELDRAQDELHSARTLGGEVKALSVMVDALLSQGALLRIDGRIDESEAALREGLSLCSQIDHTNVEGALKLELGRLLMLDRRESEAGILFEEVATIATAASDAMEHLMALAHLAALGKRAPEEVNDSLERQEDRITRNEALEIRYLLWKVSEDLGQLRAAHRILVELEDHAPPASRKCLIERIPIHREIRMACGGSRSPLKRP